MDQALQDSIDPQCCWRVSFTFLARVEPLDAEIVMVAVWPLVLNHMDLSGLIVTFLESLSL